jgi:hypothetical protein
MGRINMRAAKTSGKLLSKLLLSGAFTVAAGCITTPASRLQSELGQPKEYFTHNINVKDGALDTIALLSTEIPGRLDYGMSTSDLRGAIDKKTGLTIYALFQVIQYSGYEWQFFQSVNVETPTGTVALPVTVASRGVNGCADRNCWYTEQLSVNLDESLLRSIARKYVQGQPIAWKSKFSPKSGDDITYTMAVAEVAGFMDHMDECA